MNIHNDPAPRLTPGLCALVSQRRLQRAFDAEAAITAKAERLNAYLRASRLSSCVVAVSGGIDSAVVLGVVCRARLLPDSPLRHVVALLLPVHEQGAATNQDVATVRGREVCEAFGIVPTVLDLTGPFQTLRSTVESAMGFQGSGWAAGQLVAYQRTPAIYYVTSLLSDMKCPGILVGTTNRDEGSYLGYFGKASDGLVDVQLISDWFKSEVYAVGRALGVPDSVLTAVPTGDMYDGRVDEAVFGATYDFVELFLEHKQHPKVIEAALAALDEASRAQFAQLSGRLERLHGYNLHKYLGKSPAVHLDLHDVRIPGGWDYFVWSPAESTS